MQGGRHFAPKLRWDEIAALAAGWPELMYGTPLFSPRPRMGASWYFEPSSKSPPD